MAAGRGQPECARRWTDRLSARENVLPHVLQACGLSALRESSPPFRFVAPLTALLLLAAGAAPLPFWSRIPARTLASSTPSSSSLPFSNMFSVRADAHRDPVRRPARQERESPLARTKSQVLACVVNFSRRMSRGNPSPPCTPSHTHRGLEAEGRVVGVPRSCSVLRAPFRATGGYRGASRCLDSAQA